MSNNIRVGINGFGRIGRNLFKLLVENPKIDSVAVNDLAATSTLAHLLKYDSIHGIFPGTIEVKNEHTLIVNNKTIHFFHENHPANIPWNKANVDIVVEATGKFKTRKPLEQHFKKGIKKVILAVPPQDDSIKMIVLGVNNHILDGTENIISNASCTTNNAAPMLQLIHENFGVEQAYITTVHSFTSDQNLHDQPHADLRRSRAATQSIIPTTTGAAKALTKIFPDLNHVIGGCGIRVPVPNGSLTDMTINVKKTASIASVNSIFKEAAVGSYKGILSYTEDPIVSTDISGNSHSCIFDSEMTSVIDGKLIKLIGWYDNEIGYSNRLIDLISKF
ncbi:type I glyceraldehyde-3-phosphate dehydrogenase [Zunongwangia sp.]|uniref:type I glyceraldehyde-3-phosphate dehydrogenase n=1 Tax=Zunongwangia sp. TaxID=1965325 RepID=UPI003AA861F4